MINVSSWEHPKVGRGLMKLKVRRKKRGVDKPGPVGAGLVKGAKVTPGSYSLLPDLSKALGRKLGQTAVKSPLLRRPAGDKMKRDPVGAAPG